jgi:hypothetical protein
MITLQQFEEFPNGEIFARGELPNSPDGIFMTRDGGILKWIAVKGFGDDWTIYCHWNFQTDDYIKKHGDKIILEPNIKKCVDCDDKVFRKYRY